MDADQYPFVFDVVKLNLSKTGVFIARIPPRISEKGALFEAFRRELKLPVYFGDNWDALSDCLRDLSWIKCHAVLIQHEDLPPLSDMEVRTYLEVLADSVQDWKRDEGHELFVVFPATARDAIISVLSARGALAARNLH